MPINIKNVVSVRLIVETPFVSKDQGIFGKILKTAQKVSVLIFLNSNSLVLNIEMTISMLITKHDLHRLHMVMAVNELSRE